jgi:hypothetical protein
MLYAVERICSLSFLSFCRIALKKERLEKGSAVQPALASSFRLRLQVQRGGNPRSLNDDGRVQKRSLLHTTIITVHPIEPCFDQRRSPPLREPRDRQPPQVPQETLGESLHREPARRGLSAAMKARARGSPPSGGVRYLLEAEVRAPERFAPA